MLNFEKWVTEKLLNVETDNQFTIELKRYLESINQTPAAGEESKQENTEKGNLNNQILNIIV